jgi:poly(A) polymerase
MSKHLSSALQVISILDAAGFIAYFAGGYVRDQLLGHISEDIDIVTNASMEEIKKLFTKTIPVGAQFGIMIVVIDEEQFELATFRKEGEYTDGRHPSSIEVATPMEDAKRRDFTINGLFLDPKTQEIYDFVDGKKDLELKIIRAIGDPHKRFEEDRLRMLRAIRYACRFSFTIEEKTYLAIKKHSRDLLPSVSEERICQELSKMAEYPHFDKALHFLFDTHLLQTIFPSLKKLSDYTNYLRKLPIASPFAAKLSLIFGDIENKELLPILQNLKVSNKETSFALYFNGLKNLMLSDTQLSRYEKAKLYADRHFELSFEMLKCLPIEKRVIESHEESHIALRPHIERLVSKKSLITSQDLKDRGIAAGPQMGELLKKAEELSIESDLHDKESLFKVLF